LEGGPGLPLGIGCHALGRRAFSEGWCQTEAKQSKFKARPWAADEEPASHHALGRLRSLTIITRLTLMGHRPRKTQQHNPASCRDATYHLSPPNKPPPNQQPKALDCCQNYSSLSRTECAYPPSLQAPGSRGSALALSKHAPLRTSQPKALDCWENHSSLCVRSTPTRPPYKHRAREAPHSRSPNTPPPSPPSTTCPKGAKCDSLRQRPTSTPTPSSGPKGAKCDSLGQRPRNSTP